jgi:hypothetical protein
MESFMRRVALIFAAATIGLFSSPLEAQQSTPDQTQPPQPQSAPGVAPAPPTAVGSSHRWVDTGGYLTLEPRRKSSTPSSSKRKAATATAHSKKGRHAAESEIRHAAKSGTRAAKPLSKAELKRCKGLSSRELKRNSKCRTALQAEKKPSAHKSKPAKSLSKAETRRCQKMNYQQLLKNADCAALLQREVEAGKRTTHRSKGKKAAEHPKKAAPAKDKKHQTSTKHRRS